MKNIKNSLFYLIVIGGFSLLMYWVIQMGGDLEIGRNIIRPNSDKSQWAEFITSLQHNLQHPLAILLVQIAAIMLVARLFGWICRKIGQPSVIGEIVAGIVLGPSLLGLYFPEFSTVLFPEKSISNLQFLSQIGLILFMFVVGMELDLTVLKNQAHEAVVISHASIILPFALGLGLAYFIYPSFSPEGIPFASFGLFIGISMSITAFPVLARIVQERGIHKTRLGTVVITCAAADDITAWCLLAAVIAIVKAGSFVSALYVMLLAVIYVVVMLKGIRPFLKRIGDLHTSRENLSKPIVAIFFLILLLSAWATEVIGIHALFGAFMTGAIMPENKKFRNVFIEKVEDVALVLLLPLFFVCTGLRTQIGLLNEWYLWQIAGLIILVAVLGKFIGSALAARFVGQNWRESLTIGALMNTRGLMELVVLNIGYELGVLTPEIFAMMVIMALVTTFMTAPALDFIDWIFKTKDAPVPQEISNVGKYKILISFGNPERGRTLLRLANGLVKKMGSNATVTAMHLTLLNELNHYNQEEYQQESFEPIVEESQRLNQKIITMFKASNDIDSDIVGAANEGDYDLLLMGIGQSIFEGSLLGRVLNFTTRIINPDMLLGKFIGRENTFENLPFDDRTKYIITKSQVPVGVLIDKELQKTDKIFVPIFDESDAFLIGYAQKLIHNIGAQIIIWDATGYIKNNPNLKESIRAIEQTAPNHITIKSEKDIKEDFLKSQDLLLIGLESWAELVDSETDWMQYAPSTLILKK